MNLLTFLHFFSFATFFYLAVYILIKNPKSPLNRACSMLIFSFCIWSFSLIFAHNPQRLNETVQIGTRIYQLREPSSDIKFTVGRSFWFLFASGGNCSKLRGFRSWQNGINMNNSALNPHFSQGFVARRCRGPWIQGARLRAPQAYSTVCRGARLSAT